MSDIAYPRVMLGMPMRPGEHVVAGAAIGFYGCPLQSMPNASLIRCHASSSVLPLTFDMIWSQAINHYEAGEITHFAMCHDDVCPQPDWLAILLNELDQYEADIVSAIIPLKDYRGLTSTAIDDTGDVWNPRRLSMKEVFDRSETWTHPKILLNSGLWVCRMNRPWVTKEVDGLLACSFHQRNRIVRNELGKWRPDMRSEDWEFSRHARQAGASRQYATRKVKLYHEAAHFTNTQVWGTCTSDPDHDKPAPIVETPELELVG